MNQKPEDLIDPLKLAREHFRHMLIEIERSGRQLMGAPSQVAMLIAASLQIIDPDSDKAQQDADTLELAFCLIASDCMLQDGIDTDYGDEYEEEEQEDDEPDDSTVSPNGPSDRSFDEGPY